MQGREEPGGCHAAAGSSDAVIDGRHLLPRMQLILVRRLSGSPVKGDDAALRKLDRKDLKHFIEF